ncbi:FAD-dependent oxidoreductase [Pseudidiomarina aquimaris]|uniref:FAD-dependent oxidoreductase n=1 Tax=Pseudidiomarina aquimaris TaxID=641841 RepID=A0A432XHF4_9GAMM|nr:tryptophan 7-halogenase [Pseudidiomarina aquimaris]RUO48110.1 FAD-dependent oxidoreductase [Pseudidiomarina aquimaris]
MSQVQPHYDVIIIGAGPSGAAAASLLAQANKNVLVLERQHFPRFSIGESLLPQCMMYLEEAGLREVVEANAQELGFQFKDGAAFYRDGEHTLFDFTAKSSNGPGTTYQVKREKFDQLLIEQARNYGAEVRHGMQVEQVTLANDGGPTSLSVRNLEDDSEQQLSCDFLLDASGFGRVLPRLLDLEYPSDFPVRQAAFCHVKTDLAHPKFDRNKILITVHPTNPEIWFWLIPFADGTASLGVVGSERFFTDDNGAAAALWNKVNDEPYLLAVLGDYQVIRDEQLITGYSANVKQLHGDGFALLGNAGEFLDPVFSSGVTIALKSAVMAVPLVLRELQGETVDWQNEYSVPLRKGIDTFRTYVKGWYDCSFQDVIFYPHQQETIKQMICSILAGYAWDLTNPFVRESERRLRVVTELCQES